MSSSFPAYSWPPTPENEATALAGDRRDIEGLKRKTPPRQAAGKIAVARYLKTSALTSASFDLINWTSLDETLATSDDYFALTAGSDMQVKLPGVYAFDFRVDTISTSFTAGKLVTYLANIDVDSGSVGVWSSSVGGGADEGRAMDVLMWNDPGIGDVSVEPSPITGHVVWVAGDTMPVTISVGVQFAEDAVGRQIDTSFRCTWVRLGDADE